MPVYWSVGVWYIWNVVPGPSSVIGGVAGWGRQLWGIRGVLNSLSPRFWTLAAQKTPLGCFPKLLMHGGLGQLPEFLIESICTVTRTSGMLTTPTHGWLEPLLIRSPSEVRVLPITLTSRWIFQVSSTSRQDRPYYLPLNGKLDLRYFGLCSWSMQSRN